MKAFSLTAAYFLCLCVIYMIWLMIDHIKRFGLSYQGYALVIAILLDLCIITFLQWLYKKLPYHPKSKPFVWFEKINIWSYFS